MIHNYLLKKSSLNQSLIVQIAIEQNQDNTRDIVNRAIQSLENANVSFLTIKKISIIQDNNNQIRINYEDQWEYK